MAEETIALENAKWWENHSYCRIKEDLLAEDQAWIANQSTHIANAGTSFARIESNLGDSKILLVKRMVVDGLIAVKRSGGRIKTVHLPQDTGKLLAQDIDYISEKISEYNAPMSEEQQQDFLDSATEPSETTLQTMS